MATGAMKPIVKRVGKNQTLADGFIDSSVDLTMSGGWSCHEWLLGSKKDEEYDSNKLQKLLRWVEESMHTQSDYTKQSMNRFVIAVGVSKGKIGFKSKHVRS